MHVPVLTNGDAPAVLRVPPMDGAAAGPPATLRGWNGHLYEPMSTPGGGRRGEYAREATVLAGSPQYPVVVSEHDRHHSRAAAIADITSRYAQHLVIDGAVWVRTTEPAYHVTTFGAGHNQGSTALLLSRDPHDPMTTHPVTDRDAAIAQAREIARARGDARSITRFDSVPGVDVLDPQYVNRPHLADVRRTKEQQVLALLARAAAMLRTGASAKGLCRQIISAQGVLEEALRIAEAL